MEQFDRSKGQQAEAYASQHLPYPHSDVIPQTNGYRPIHRIVTTQGYIHTVQTPCNYLGKERFHPPPYSSRARVQAEGEGLRYL